MSVRVDICADDSWALRPGNISFTSLMHCCSLTCKAMKTAVDFVYLALPPWLRVATRQKPAVQTVRNWKQHGSTSSSRPQIAQRLALLLHFNHQENDPKLHAHRAHVPDVRPDVVMHMNERQQRVDAASSCGGAYRVSSGVPKPVATHCSGAQAVFKKGVNVSWPFCC